MLSVFIGGISYPVTIDVNDGGDKPREVIKTSADCPRCTERPTDWEHSVTYDHFVDYKPGALICSNCDHVAPLMETV